LSYYTVILTLSWITLGILCILVAENGRLAASVKRSCYLSYVVIAASALAEWIGLRLNGDLACPVELLKAVKCADYILTPMACVLIVRQMGKKRTSIWEKLINWILLANTIFQLVCVFTGWMVTTDAGNHYSKGPLYSVYAVLYFVLIILTVIEFVSYGQRFRRQNRLSLYATLFLIVAGILIQELWGVRVAYLALTLGMALLYIHNTEFSQLAADDALKEQRISLMLSQIRPHFLFNTLAVIREIYRSDPEKGDTAITEFAGFLRHNMEALSVEKPIPFTEELDFVRRYLDLQMLRFGDELTVNYDLEATDFSLPVLTLQPIVENAVTYGVRKQRKRSGIVTIRSLERDERFEIHVIDNGPGFDPETLTEENQEAHIGLKNVRERLRHTCGGELEVNSVCGTGTTVILIIPKEGDVC